MADAVQSRSFGRAADAYGAARPSYPRQAVAWLLGDAVDVADVGAGTGKLTAVVAALGRRVRAVEPDAEMLARLTAALPDVPALTGTAESLPLPDASVDAVVLGQAWHWVDVPAASAEAARVLRPGGVLAPVWNIRDDREPWVAAYGAAMHGSEAEALIAAGGPAVAAPFPPFEERRFEWSRSVAPGALVELAASRSYVITRPPAERAAVLERVRQVLATHPDTRGRDEIALPYVTHAYRSVLPAGAGAAPPPPRT